MTNQTPLDVSKIQQICESVKSEIGQVIVGNEAVIDDLLICLMCKGHLFMIGVPGIAKTTLAKTFAMVTGLSWNRVQFTQDLLPADILGHFYFDQQQNEFKMRKGPVFNELILADEINRSSPKTQSALIEAMQERQVTIEGQTMMLPQPFLVIATKNPIETEGIYPLPEAQLDRFLLSVEMDYLSKDDELELLQRKNENMQATISVSPVEEVTSLIGMHHQVHVADSVLSYLMDIIEKTREYDQIVMGASPRAGEQLLYATKAFALIHGRDYVIPDDVKTVAFKVLSHRLILSTEAELDGVSTRKIIDDILSLVPVPDMVESVVEVSS